MIPGIMDLRARGEYAYLVGGCCSRYPEKIQGHIDMVRNLTDEEIDFPTSEFYQNLRQRYQEYSIETDSTDKTKDGGFGEEHLTALCLDDNPLLVVQKVWFVYEGSDDPNSYSRGRPFKTAYLMKEDPFARELFDWMRIIKK